MNAVELPPELSQDDVSNMTNQKTESAVKLGVTRLDESITASELLASSSFTLVTFPSPELELEMTVNYPLNLLSRLLPLLPKIYEVLDGVGEDIGFTFGYDILPISSTVEEPDDLEVFTGNGVLLLDTDV